MVFNHDYVFGFFFFYIFINYSEEIHGAQDVLMVGVFFYQARKHSQKRFDYVFQIWKHLTVVLETKYH